MLLVLLQTCLDFGQSETSGDCCHSSDEARGIDTDVEDCAICEHHRQRLQRPHQTPGGSFLLYHILVYSF